MRNTPSHAPTARIACGPMRRTMLLLSTVTVLAGLPVATAAAQDPAAPKGAPKHWLPDEEWVNNLWLPYDEDRLTVVLRMSRGEIFRHVRVDATNTLAQLGRRKGMSTRTMARRLVANRRGKVRPATLRLLERHAERTLTQGHLGQHFLFHALHQVAIPNRATRIFGVPSQLQFVKLRRNEISPLQIGDLYGKSRVELQRGAERALRDAAARGVGSGQLTPLQASRMLDRQLRQLPRWLGQSRYNGPSGGRNQLKLPPGDVAKHPQISADGTRAVWDAYRLTVSLAERLGEIHVQGRDLAVARRHGVSPPGDPASRRPRSAYNSVLSADGGTVAFESAESTYPLAKRVGQMSIFARDLKTRKLQKISHLGLPKGAPTRTAFNPAISGDGGLVAFEATDSGRNGKASQNGLWVVDRAAGTQRLLTRESVGVAYLPRISSDGTTVAYTAALEENDGLTLLYARPAGGGERILLSRADGTDGAPADRDAYEPSLSADGKVVAFTSRAGNLGRAGRTSTIFVRDLVAGTTTPVSAAVPGDAFQPAISADGRFVTFAVRPRGRAGRPAALRSRIHLHDRRTRTTTLISRRTGARGAASDGYASEPQVSADGTKVVFTSTAGNLSAKKKARLAGVFVRDVAKGTTTLLSDHRRGGGASLRTVASPFGRTAAARPDDWVCHLAG